MPASKAEIPSASAAHVAPAAGFEAPLPEHLMWLLLLRRCAASSDRAVAAKDAGASFVVLLLPLLYGPARRCTRTH